MFPWEPNNVPCFSPYFFGIYPQEHTLGTFLVKCFWIKVELLMLTDQHKIIFTLISPWSRQSLWSDCCFLFYLWNYWIVEVISGVKWYDLSGGGPGYRAGSSHIRKKSNKWAQTWKPGRFDDHISRMDINASDQIIMTTYSNYIHLLNFSLNLIILKMRKRHNTISTGWWLLCSFN